MQLLNNIRIVLSHPTHPGNIGSCARAMKNMGLSCLYLINPKSYPSNEATVLAKSAADVLDNAVVCKSLDEAIKDCSLVFGTSGRGNKVAWPTLNLKPAVDTIKSTLLENPSAKVAILFGTESSGLSNQEIHNCNYQVVIPTSKDYSSINLSQAVQIVSYELMSMLADESIKTNFNQKNDLSDRNMNNQIYDLIEDIACSVEYINPQKPENFPIHIKKILAKSQLEQSEIKILFGLLKKIKQKI